MRRKKLRRVLVDSSIEKLILTGIITSHKFLEKIRDHLNPRLFAMDHSSIITKWCIEYFDSEGKAPRKRIETIFELEKESLTATTQLLVEAFLSNLSDEYVYRKKFNYKYLLKKADKYFQERGIIVMLEDVSRLTKAGKFDRAKKLTELYMEGGYYSLTGLDKVDDMHDSMNKAIINEYSSDEDRTEELLQCDGDLGELLGMLKRKWLIAILAPMKRGKSWNLDHIGLQGLWKGLFVFKASLEMSPREQARRMYKMMTGTSDEGGMTKVPCFDCLSNQDGSCRLDRRTNPVKLAIGVSDEGELILPEFKPRMRYKPCTACRNHEKQKIRDKFIPAVWYYNLKTKKMTPRIVSTHMKNFKIHGGGDLTTKSYSFDGTLANIRNDMIEVTKTKKKTPDILVLDYADLIQLEPDEMRTLSERGRVDHIWKYLKNLSVEFNCLVVTATQGNRKSFEIESLSETNVSEDVRKLAHCDAMFTLNQTPRERANGYMRYGMINHRHFEITRKEVITLQALGIGNPVFDSEWMYNTPFDNH